MAKLFYFYAVFSRGGDETGQFLIGLDTLADFNLCAYTVGCGNLYNSITVFTKNSVKI